MRFNSALDQLAYAILAELLRDYPLPKPPAIVWRRYRTTAGTADYNTWTINLSAVVLDDEAKLDSTLRHEYAHLLTFARYGPKHGRGHGPAWRSVMQEMGQTPDVRHCYSAQRNQKRQVVIYKCLRCGEHISRHRRLPRRRKYAHINCGGLIQFVEVQAA
ncbi:MAG: SprT-like domain-containing protein [Chthonomonas sp.]|nr:SprT-like domain-containing protein [Chthonomonas sp.]